MSYLKKFKVTDKLNAYDIICGIHAIIVRKTYATKYRGIEVTISDLNNLIDEAKEVGFGDWGILKVNASLSLSNSSVDSLIQGVDFFLASKNDTALAALYLYKVKDSVERGIEFSLSISDLKKIISKKTCYFTGRRFVDDYNSMDKISLDRLDSAVGYTKENTVACCLWVNKLKNDLFENPRREYEITPNDLFKFAEKVKNITPRAKRKEE